MFKRARILSYDASSRTAQVHIFGLTDGASDGLTATFAFPVGDDDRDTEIKIMDNVSSLPDVFVFFDGGNHECPVVAFFSSHGEGNIQDIRRIRQKNIELLAEDKIYQEANIIHLSASKVIIDADIEHTGNQNTTGTVTADTDVVGGGKSLKSHTHGGVDSGSSSTSVPN